MTIYEKLATFFSRDKRNCSSEKLNYEKSLENQENDKKFVNIDHKDHAKEFYDKITEQSYLSGEYNIKISYHYGYDCKSVSDSITHHLKKLGMSGFQVESEFFQDLNKSHGLFFDYYYNTTIKHSDMNNTSENSFNYHEKYMSQKLNNYPEQKHIADEYVEKIKHDENKGMLQPQYYIGPQYNIDNCEKLEKALTYYMRYSGLSGFKINSNRFNIIGNTNLKDGCDITIVPDKE